MVWGINSWLLCHFPKSSLWHPSSGLLVCFGEVGVFKAHKGKKRRSSFLGARVGGRAPKCQLHLLCVVTPHTSPSVMVRLVKAAAVGLRPVIEQDSITLTQESQRKYLLHCVLGYQALVLKYVRL